MKLELIVPATHKNRGKQKKALIPPLGLAMVAALTPPDIEVSLTDENVTAIDFQKQIDLVGITALTVTAQRAYQIADTFRAKGVQVVLGGIHPSVLPEEARQHADAIVIGEAEGVWPKVIEDFKANKLQGVYQEHERSNLGWLAYSPTRPVRRWGVLCQEHALNYKGVSLFLCLLHSYLFLRP